MGESSELKRFQCRLSRVECGTERIKGGLGNIFCDLGTATEGPGTVGYEMVREI